MPRKLTLGSDKTVRDDLGTPLSERGRDGFARERETIADEQTPRKVTRLRWRRLLTGLRTQANSNRRSA
jgi:hypothetical protein